MSATKSACRPQSCCVNSPGRALGSRLQLTDEEQTRSMRIPHAKNKKTALSAELQGAERLPCPSRRQDILSNLVLRPPSTS
ncbi:hypothetical protein NDU88_004432 [Pleurodeles waltl]|uniref:Uncharacterized protein n=1 Tax=Pleurodeles waltl TaxID=8319 RepID=A0AAV7V2Z9_PLEWA|nr:hypothetical protein NDU88_004432 [Pleurodeles waltl]